MEIDNQQQRYLEQISLEGVVISNLIFDKRLKVDPYTIEYKTNFVKTMYKGLTEQIELFNISRAVCKKFRKLVFNEYEAIPLPKDFKVIPFPNGQHSYMTNDTGTLILRAKTREPIKMRPNTNGYIMADTRYLTETGTLFKNERVHRIVALTYIQNPTGLSEVNHIDGVKSNNSYTNLEWCTRTHNIQHAVSEGLLVNPKGEATKNSKLTEEAVLFARKTYAEVNSFVKTNKLVHSTFGIKVSDKIIRDAVLKLSWKHI